MPDLSCLSPAELEGQLHQVQKHYDHYVAMGLDLNMARGKPCPDQLDLSREMLNLPLGELLGSEEFSYDWANYGMGLGLPEARRLMASILDADPKTTLVGGCASLNLMYDTLAYCWMFGTQGHKPWCQLDTVKWICLTPGYDRHFAMLEAFGIQMISVPLLADGPDMDAVENLVSEDVSIKGIWCVPYYSNPSGTCYSLDAAQRLATMPCAAEDFRIFWDNAYAVHHLYAEDEVTPCPNILDLCEKAGNPNRAYVFSSTSKISFAQAGISALATSKDNFDEITKHQAVQTIGFDKINQLRHVLFFKNKEGIDRHMRRHAEILRPKFELVIQKLEAGLSDQSTYGPLGSWTRPSGGYFIHFESLPGCAQRIVELAKQAGVVLTQAGATHPYGRDPRDSAIRIAPSYPSCADLEQAMDVFICCVRYASLEQEYLRRKVAKDTQA